MYSIGIRRLRPSASNNRKRLWLMMPINLPSRSIRVRLSLWITFHVPWVSTVASKVLVSNSTFSVANRAGAQASGPRSTISASSFLQDLMLGASHNTSVIS